MTKNKNSKTDLDRIKDAIRTLRLDPKCDMSICTTLGKKGSVDDIAIYKDKYKIDFDRSAEILSYMVDTGVFPEEVQQALCLAIRAIALCKLTYK